MLRLVVEGTALLCAARTASSSFGVANLAVETMADDGGAGSGAVAGVNWEELIKSSKCLSVMFDR